MSVNNKNVKEEVIAAIRGALPFSQEAIGITVDEGIVILSGTVETPDEKEIAAAVTKAVPGVKAIVQKLEIEISPERLYADALSEKIRAGFKAQIGIPQERISIRIEARRLTLEGELRWHYQKDVAIRIASEMAGNREVVDLITVDNTIKEGITREHILQSIKTDGRTVCDDLDIIVNGRNIILIGSVPTVAQSILAKKIAEAIPGINSVTNALHIR